MPEQNSAALKAANINPKTGLATDYLNHFNEAIMILEMIPDMPDCFEELLNWQPLTYRQHFEASGFKARDLAIAAYDKADPKVRSLLDHYTDAMTRILITLRDAMAEVHSDRTRVRLAEQGATWLKPMVAHAGAIINGARHIEASDTEPQAGVDFIMAN